MKKLCWGLIILPIASVVGCLVSIERAIFHIGNTDMNTYQALFLFCLSPFLVAGWVGIMAEAESEGWL